MTVNPFDLTLADIMSRDVVTVTGDEKVSSAVKKMESRGIGAVVVLDENKKIIGIFSERDVLFRVIAKEKKPAKTKISEVMTINPRTLNAGLSVFEAYELSQEGNFRHIPIVENGSLLGMVSTRDINRAFYSEKDVLSNIKMKFAMITSHELKTPCTVLKSCMYLLKDEMGGFTDDQKNLINKIDKNIKRLSEIMNNLERLYSVDVPDIEGAMKLSSMEEIIQSAAEDLSPIIVERKQELSLKISGNMPDIMLDRSGISEVIMNLMLNSIRFTPDGGRIIVRARNENDYIRVEVEDNGIGIPYNKLKVIFESFYEIQDTMEHTSAKASFKSGGLGLGLSIAKNIIDSHHGRIWSESKEGRYSKFIFTLPKNRKTSYYRLLRNAASSE